MNLTTKVTIRVSMDVDADTTDYYSLKDVYGAAKREVQRQVIELFAGKAVLEACTVTAVLAESDDSAPRVDRPSPEDGGR